LFYAVLRVGHRAELGDVFDRAVKGGSKVGSP
jgi:hypothetical protein